MSDADKGPGIRVKFGESTGQKMYQVRGPGSHIWYGSPQEALTQYNKLKNFAAAGGFTQGRNK